ncbi:MAG: hypothetical protein PVH30_07090 [Desulfobacterales bacterium]|jgi:hypothetical protein
MIDLIQPGGPLWLTLKVAGLATLAAFVMGVGAAFAVTRRPFPGRDVVDALCTLPLVLPPTVLGYYLLVLIGRRGLIGQWLKDTFDVVLMFTWQGAVVAAVRTDGSGGSPSGGCTSRPFRPEPIGKVAALSTLRGSEAAGGSGAGTRH